MQESIFFIALHLDHEIDRWCFVVSIYIWHSLTHEDMYYYEAMNNFRESLQMLYEMPERSLCKAMK